MYDNHQDIKASRRRLPGQGPMLTYPRSRRTLRFPITLSVILMVLNLVLMVCWIVLLARISYYSALTIGTVLFSLILVGLVAYMILTIKEIRLNQRQANFVDSVTHELKSPIASLKLYLETLLLRDVDTSQREGFYRFMVDDLNRLDRLINQLLEVGRLDAIVGPESMQELSIEPILRNCAQSVCVSHAQPSERFAFHIEPAIVRGSSLALEMVFRNLLDNAIKYGGDEPRVDVDVQVKGNTRVVTRISDNGSGVPPGLRKKIFNLFYRGGSELTRTRTGTGLGLYIVQTLVRRMRGKVTVHNRSREPGAVFEVELPGRALPCTS